MTPSDRADRDIISIPEAIKRVSNHRKQRAVIKWHVPVTQERTNFAASFPQKRWTTLLSEAVVHARDLEFAGKPNVAGGAPTRWQS